MDVARISPRRARLQSLLLVEDADQMAKVRARLPPRTLGPSFSPEGNDVIKPKSTPSHADDGRSMLLLALERVLAI
jgi:hypothetical protein